MKSLYDSKKGIGINAVIMPLVFILILAISLMIIHLVWDKIISVCSNIAIFNTYSQSLTIMNKAGRVVYIFDYVIATMTLAVIAGIGITSYRIATNRIFLAIVMVTSIIYGFIAYVLSYVGASILVVDQINSIIVYYPKTSLIITNFHWIALVQIVIGILATYAKMKQGQIRGSLQELE